jgi:hypothetical protein
MSAGIFHFLQSQPFFVIFGVVALGMWLGRQKLGGISLGSVVCIILVGLLTSIWSYNATGVSLALPDVLKTVFFNLFIFAIGVKIGPQFFAGLERDGWHLVAIGPSWPCSRRCSPTGSDGCSSGRRARWRACSPDRTIRRRPSARPRPPCSRRRPCRRPLAGRWTS